MAPNPNTETRPSPPHPAGHTHVTAGTLIGGYEVRGVIGEGGMGTIYAGIHPIIRKRVAIKVLNRGLANDRSIVARFVLEARSVNEIGHHNIVDIFSIGTLEDGRHYFVMEFLDGVDLEVLLSQVGRLEPGEVLPVYRQLCEALEAAHSKGFVHRDLKPSNIFLLRRPPHPYVKILDFGLAKLRTTSSTEGTQLTDVQALIGTPAYMAPEQWCDGIADARSDIYALGVMLYELLTGHHPFEGKTPLTMLEMLRTGATFKPPSDHLPMSKALEEVILTAMGREAGRRYQSASELLLHLRQAIPEPLAWRLNFDALEMREKTVRVAWETPVTRWLEKDASHVGLGHLLRLLCSSSPDIVGAAVVSLDGEVVASSLDGEVIASINPGLIDEDLVGSMAAAMFGVSEQITTAIARVKVEQTVVKTDQGYIVLNALGTDDLVVLLVTSWAKLGLVFFELDRMMPELLAALPSRAHPAG